MSCTDSVDNFVKNRASKACEPAPGLGFVKTISKQAVQNAFESMCYCPKTSSEGLLSHFLSIHAACGHFCSGDARG
jgi:hypothetical protein